MNMHPLVSATKAGCGDPVLDRKLLWRGTLPTALSPERGRRSRASQTEVRGLVHPAPALCTHLNTRIQLNTDRSFGLLLWATCAWIVFSAAVSSNYLPSRG